MGTRLTALLLAGALELAVPPLFRLVEGGSDVPVLTGLFYPYLLLISSLVFIFLVPERK